MISSRSLSPSSSSLVHFSKVVVAFYRENNSLPRVINKHTINVSNMSCASKRRRLVSNILVFSQVFCVSRLHRRVRFRQNLFVSTKIDFLRRFVVVIVAVLNIYHLCSCYYTERFRPITNSDSNIVKIRTTVGEWGIKPSSTIIFPPNVDLTSVTGW